MSITTPTGFSAAATTAGIKASGKKDMALVVNNGPDYTAAGVFTRNRVVAAPVKLTRRAVADGQLRAVVYNSGNANACNGAQGDADAYQTAEQLAVLLDVPVSEVAVCSTGLIGEPLPMPILLGGLAPLVDGLGSQPTDGTAAAEAIMTTDMVVKETVVHGEGWTIGGMGKGAGMMAPSLAATSVTFDTLDIDGSTSTNDTVVLLASGASGVTPSQEEFAQAVRAACDDLASQMQADAEGVTKRVSITVVGTSTDEQALAAARTVGRDNLFKCAMFGSDPNWGRVLAAVGMADADMDPEHISVYFNDQAVCLDSCGAPGARDVDLSGADIEVRIDLGTGGPGRATVKTTDLSHAYVEINSEYST